ncbi:hypothetical protein Tco_0260398 [Tanacetum coccineum]
MAVATSAAIATIFTISDGFNDVSVDGLRYLGGFGVYTTFVEFQQSLGVVMVFWLPVPPFLGDLCLWRLSLTAWPYPCTTTSIVITYAAITSSATSISWIHCYGHFCRFDFIGLFRGSVGMSTARVILFGTIPTDIPTTIPIVDPPIVHDDTPLIPIETPTIPPVVSTLPHTSLFLYIDSSNSDTFERLPSHNPYEVNVARWRSQVAVRSSPPSPPTLLDRPYRTQPNGVHKMLTTRKSVGPLPSHRLALRYSESHSSSDHFSSDNFSSNTSLGSSSGYSSNTSSGRSIPDYSFDSPAASFAGLSRKRHRSLTVSTPLASPIPRAFYPVHADLLPPCKRIRGSVSMTAQDDSTEESYEAYIEPDIDSDIQADIDADIAAAEAAAAWEVDVRVEIDARFDREDEDDEEDESSHRGNVEIEVDTVSEPIASEDTLVPIDNGSFREDV